MDRATAVVDLRNCVDALKREIDQLESLAGDTRTPDAVLQHQASRAIEAQREVAAAGGTSRRADGAATARHAPQKPGAAPPARSATNGPAAVFQRTSATTTVSSAAHQRAPVAMASAREYVAGSGCRVARRVNAGWAIPSEWDAPGSAELTAPMAAAELAGPPCAKPKTSVVSPRATTNEISPPSLPWKGSTAHERTLQEIRLGSAQVASAGGGAPSASSSMPPESACVSIRVRRTDGVVSEIPKRFKPSDCLSAIFLECSRLHFIPANIRAQDVFLVVPWLKEKYGMTRAEHVSLREASLCPTATVTLECR